MGELPSVDELLECDPGSLDDVSLKRLVLCLSRARSRLDAAELAAIAELDTRGAHEIDGAANATSWLAYNTGVARRTAGGRVRLARHLRQMPRFAAALTAGAISEGHVRSASRCLTPRTAGAFADSEEMLVGMAGDLDADTFDRAISVWLRVHDADGPEPPGGGAESEARFAKTLGGRGRLDADLSIGDAEEVRAELDRLADEEFRADQAVGVIRTRAQRMGAALAEMARRSSATRRTDPDDDEDGGGGIDPDTAGSSPRRPQLSVIVPLGALTGEPTDAATLEDGTVVPADVLHRWACDSHVGRVVMAGASEPVDLGRLSRVCSAAQRRALIAKYGRCIVAGCGRAARWCAAHHVTWWTNGGTTDLSNLVLVCARHHTLLHAKDPPIVLQRHARTGEWEVRRRDGTPLAALRHQPPAVA